MAACWRPKTRRWLRRRASGLVEVVFELVCRGLDNESSTVRVSRNEGVPVRIAIVTLVMWLGLTAAPPATADPGPTPMDPSSAEGAAVLAPAVADAAAQLGKPIRLDVRSLKAADGWAFLWSAMQEPDGSPVDYTGTPFAEAAAERCLVQEIRGPAASGRSGLVARRQARGAERYRLGGLECPLWRTCGDLRYPGLLADS